MNKLKLTIALTGLSNIDNPSPGTPFIRCLKNSDLFDCRFIGLVYDHMEPSIYMNSLSDKIYIVPNPLMGDISLLPSIRAIHEREQIDVLFPLLDPEIPGFINESSALSDMGIKTFLPTNEQFEERLKENLMSFGKKYDVNIPFSVTIHDPNNFKQLTANIRYPVVVKSKHYVTSVADNPDMAKACALRLKETWGGPVTVQEFVKGEELCIAAVGDGNGNTLASIPLKKLAYNEKGTMAFAISIMDNEITKLTSEIIRKTKWRGGLEIEFIRTPEGELFTFEINPRIPAWIYYAMELGQNIPELLVNLALGMEVLPKLEYRTDKVFYRYSWESSCNLADFNKLKTTGEL